MTNGTLIDDSRDEELAKWEIGILACTLVIILIGNSLVLFAIYLKRYYSNRKKLTRMHFFIMHLSVADILTGVLNVLPQMVWKITFRFQGGPILCKFIKFDQPIGPYLSSYILTSTAMDRYHAICFPFSYCRTTSKRSRIMVYCSWIIALTLCTPQVFVFSYQEIAPGVWDCWATFSIYGQKAYVTWYSISVFLLPFTVLVYTYTGICIGVWKNSGVSDPLETRYAKNQSSQKKEKHPIINQAKINTMKQTIVVVTLYVLTWSPFIICELWMAWDSRAANSSIFDGPVFTVLSLLSCLTSCANPWIYIAFNSELRIILMNFVRRITKHKYSPGSEEASRNGNSNDPSTTSSMISKVTIHPNTVVRKNSEIKERNI
ncbi:arg8-vasotocin receptor-like [Belonocnema kinseyi]|uniref:arg8-vasotocin receptor-like n=1 Tax=Belonocnema kinseyi TaxID=2817044 RepID=UPI00143DAFE4|nr:arg8-vasotocin receptor-like [Belonocnema kinseyi]